MGAGGAPRAGTALARILMPSWVAAASIAVLVATVPMSWVLRIMRDLPEPLLASRRRWAAWANSLLIGAVTVAVAVFVRFAYYTAQPAFVSLGFGIAVTGIIYVFGMVLLVRQFEGLYPEYFVTAGRSGLTPRKAVYRHVVAVETLIRTRRETLVRIEMSSGESLRLGLPTDRVFMLYEAIDRDIPAG